MKYERGILENNMLGSSLPFILVQLILYKRWKKGIYRVDQSAVPNQSCNVLQQCETATARQNPGTKRAQSEDVTA